MPVKLNLAQIARRNIKKGYPFIVKIQRPITTNDPEHPTVLVYDEFRIIEENFPYDERFAKMFAEGEFKIYRFAKMKKGKTLEIYEKKVLHDDPDW